MEEAGFSEIICVMEQIVINPFRWKSSRGDLLEFRPSTELQKLRFWFHLRRSAFLNGQAFPDRPIVHQNPDRRRLQIIELAHSNAACTRPCGSGPHQDRRRQCDKDDAQFFVPSLAVPTSNVLEPSVKERMVKELIGIRIAASSGLIKPQTAKPTAIEL